MKSQNIQNLLDENLSLKKALNLAKCGLEKSEYDYGCLKQLYQQIKHKFQDVKIQNNQLIKKNYVLQNEKVNLEKDMEFKIFELKEILDQKEKEIEEIQIKVLPSYDQDMMKVKLINEMEGPYQETVNKKDAEIQKLQRELSESNRKASLFQFKYNNQRQEHCKQVEQIREFFKRENQKLNGEINNLLSRNEGRDKERQVIKKLKKDVEELRLTLELKEQEVEELRIERDIIREQKNEYMFKYSNKINSQNNEKNMYSIQLHKNLEKLKSKDLIIERLEKEQIKYREDARELRSKLEDKMNENKKLIDKLEQTKERIKQNQQQLSNTRYERDRLNKQVESLQKDNAVLSRDVQNKLNQIASLEEKLARQKKLKENLEYDYHDKMQEFSERKNKSTQRIDDPQLKQTLNQLNSLKKQNQNLKQRIQSNENKNEQNFKKTQRNGEEDQKIKQLRQKLNEANKKIVELIKQKIKAKDHKPIQNNYLQQSNYYGYGYDTVDAGLTPLVPTRLRINSYMPTYY